MDLEDRQMALMYKRLRSASSSPWIQTRLSPSEALEVTTEVNHQHHWGRTTWCDPTKVRGDVPAMNGDFIAKLRETTNLSYNHVYIYIMYICIYVLNILIRENFSHPFFVPAQVPVCSIQGFQVSLDKWPSVSLPMQLGQI